LAKARRRQSIVSRLGQTDHARFGQTDRDSGADAERVLSRFGMGSFELSSGGGLSVVRVGLEALDGMTHPIRPN
jgi:hypothetical protein